MAPTEFPSIHLFRRIPMARTGLTVSILCARSKSPLPTLEDAARCYGRITGVKPDEFLRAARSFGVEFKMRATDAQISAMQVPGTPCLVVDGKYRIELDTLSSAADVIDLVNLLVKKASRR
jgi:thiol:disulfide interchange protein DsbA